MKFSRLLLLISSLSASLALLTNCTQEEIEPGLDASRPAPSELTYDEAMSGKTSISLYWTPDEAIQAGAQSFTVQLTKSTEENSGDIYNSTYTQLIPADSESNNLCTFSKLDEGSRYYVRIRANYRNSVFSEWVYLMDPETQKEAIIKAGEGFFDGPISDITKLTARLRASTATELAVEWSITDFTDKEADIKDGYTIALYTDAECSNLVVKWTIAEGGMGIDDKGGNVGMFYCSWTKENLFPTFKFGALKPDTEYWFNVTSTSREGFSYTESYKTAPSKVTYAETEAAEGSVILYEDFGELLWGGDAVLYIPGYSSANRTSVTSIKPASGEDPLGDEEFKFYQTDCRTEMGLFNTLEKAIPETRLDSWGWMAEDNKTGTVLARPGFVKIGASSKCAYIVTPELKSLSKVANVTVTFDASPYKESKMDPLTATIFAVENSSSDEKHLITGTKVLEQPFTLENAYGWKSYTFKIEGVTPGSRIAIGSDRQGVDGQHRFHIDNISITLDSYATSISLKAPEKLELTVKENMVTASWNAVSQAQSYTLEYKKASESESAFKSATAEKITGTSYTLKDLEDNTEYSFRVKAHSGSESSDWSSIVNATTQASSGVNEIKTKLVEATANELIIAWSISDFKDATLDYEDGYTIALYKDQGCQDLVVKWDISAKNKVFHWKSGWAPQPAPTSFIFPGLTPETSYYFKAVSTTRGIESAVTEFKTIKSNHKALAQRASSGDILLYEDFSELVWGGNAVYYSAGHTSKNRSTVTSIKAANGENPTENAEYSYDLANLTTEMGLFNTLKNAIPTTSLKDWGWMAEGDNVGSICARPGHLKLGAGSKCGTIVTPALKCLNGNSTVIVEFDMCPYVEKAPDPYTAVISVIDGGSAEASEKYINKITGNTTVVKEFTFDSEYAWKHYSFEITDVKPGARIAIGTDRQGVTGQHRVYLDNIKLTLK